jgi:integrase
MPKLTKRVVDAAEPASSKERSFLWDTQARGFGLMIMRSGVKSYVLQYRTREGRSRRYSIGKHGSPWTCEQARGAAEKLLYEVAAGGDPMEMKREARIASTLSDLADLYIEEGRIYKPNKKASSWATDRSLISRHIRPLLGRKPVRSLTSGDVARFQQDVADGKTAADENTGFRGRAIVVGGKGIAARSVNTLSAMLQFAVGRGLIPNNPARGVKLFAYEKCQNFLNYEQVVALGETISAMEAEGTLNPGMAMAMRLLILTGCRKSELLKLTWREVDFERGVLALDNSKTGAKTVPLAAAALKLLSEIYDENSIYVFPSERYDGHLVGIQKAWERVRKRAGMPGLRLHDLRHSFASFAVADGATLFLVGKILGHADERTTSRYAHVRNDPVKAIADRTAAKIAAALGGRFAPEGGRPVAPMRPRKYRTS